jgi:hypothetical protein
MQFCRNFLMHSFSVCVFGRVRVCVCVCMNTYVYILLSYMYKQACMQCYKHIAHIEKCSACMYVYHSACMLALFVDMLLNNVHAWCVLSSEYQFFEHDDSNFFYA